MSRTKITNSRILILYAEVMDYISSAISVYKEQFPSVEILLFELDYKKLTPFSFNSNSFIYKKKSDYLDYKSFLNECVAFNPDVVLTSGRMDKDYLKVCKFFKKNNIYTVTLQDTIYVNSFRQNFIRFLSPLLYKRFFSGFWGAGSPQTSFAYSLGFASENIFEGVYSANTNIFVTANDSFFTKKEDKTILFVGRLSPEKNILNLINNIKYVNQKLKKSHKLIIIGSGILKDELSKLLDENIIHYPFISSEEIVEISKNVDVCCLPSHYEPWGLVIHEFALLSKPLLLSQNCGAKSKFFIEGYNGFSFSTSDNHSFKENLEKILTISDELLKTFGLNSGILSRQHSLERWSAVLNSILIRALYYKNEKK